MEAATVPTRGAAGWEHFVIDGRDYLSVANFFTSSPKHQPRMQTESVVYSASADPRSGKLALTELQRFPTVGAHGVVHCESAGHHYLAVPNYYGGDTVVLRWDGTVGKFTKLQTIESDGGGSIEAFRLNGRQMLAIAEFNVGVAALYVLQSTSTSAQELFIPWQRVKSPGCGSIAALNVTNQDGTVQPLLLAASYVTRETGWHTRSPIFALNGAGAAFEPHSAVATIGAHDVAVYSVAGRHFAFYSNDKDERSTKQPSELFEWIGGFPGGKLESRQTVQTDGAHAAEFFASADGNAHYLAVANLGDRHANTYRRDSVIFSFDPDAPKAKMLTALQRVATRGATDFRAFVIGGMTFVAVSNEQDDTGGGDIGSTIWVLRREVGKDVDDLVVKTSGGYVFKDEAVDVCDD